MNKQKLIDKIESLNGSAKETVYSLLELAKLLNVTERTIDRYREKGMPCTVLPTGTVRFNLEDVNKWIKGE